MVKELGGRLAQARQRLDSLGRQPRTGAPRVEAVFAAAAGDSTTGAPPPANDTPVQGGEHDDFLRGLDGGEAQQQGGGK